MISALGYLTLTLAFLLTVYGLIAVIWGRVERSSAWIESARLALKLIFPLITVSILVICYLLLKNRFDVAYVFSVTSREMPAYLRLTALWGGQAGSLLFWSWLLSAFCLVFSLKRWQEDRDLLPWVLLVAFITLGFFLALSVFVENPFERFWHLPDGTQVLAVFQPVGSWLITPQDGQGMNPLLRHPGMIWHPPALYLGFVGFIVPFALGIASLAAGRRDSRWIDLSRVWTLIAWVFLSLGLVLGMRWAYDVLGWGGYWGWDPVEVAALLPWLSGTAFLHTAMLQKRSRAYRRWNLILIILTFGLVIFGTFVTRSGVLSSVHAFGESGIGVPFFVFTAFLSLGSLGLLAFRWDSLRSAYNPVFRFSREVVILFTNLIFLSILMVSILGMIYPLVSELIFKTPVTVGPVWYERINGPLFLLLVLLTGVCPLAIWAGTTLRRLGNQLRIILPLSLLIPIGSWLTGVREIWVLFALWGVGFAGLVILRDLFRAVRTGWLSGSGGFFKVFGDLYQQNRRRIGGMLVHLGIVLIGLGIIGIEGLQQETQVTLDLGESVVLEGYEFTFEGLENYNLEGERNIMQAVLTIQRAGKPLGALYPARQFYLNWGQIYSQPGTKSSLAGDLYAILVDWRPAPEEEATFKIFVNPLVNWLWIGTGVLTVGTVVAVLSGHHKKRPARIS